MALMVLYPSQVTQFETDYEYILSRMSDDNQFKKDILRSMIRQKGVSNICPITGETNTYQTFSDAPSLADKIKDVYEKDVTRNCFLQLLRNYFNQLEGMFPTANDFVNYLTNLRQDGRIIFERKSSAEILTDMFPFGAQVKLQLKF